MKFPPIDRRTFITGTAALSGSVALTGFDPQLVHAQQSSDYRALVVVFLNGGADHWNMVAPFDEGNHQAYRSARPALALSRQQLANTVLPTEQPANGRTFALHPSMASLLPIFRAGDLAFVMNTGTLVEPVSRSQYLAKSARLPPKLFSHNDQASFFQSSSHEGAKDGWGGRLGDFLTSYNSNPFLTGVSLAQNAPLLYGRSIRPYSLAPQGAVEILNGTGGLFGSGPALDTLKAIITAEPQSALASEHAKTATRALQTSRFVNEAIGRAPEIWFSQFTSASGSLGEQLQMIARMISAAPVMGARRQVFYASMGGWDQHSDLMGSHEANCGMLAHSLAAFHDAVASLGLGDQVVTFVGSEFGRSLGTNGDGSDHGWGTTSMVMGGRVAGGIYGNPPAIGLETADIVDNGRAIPTTSIDQVVARLALFMGAQPQQLSSILPNLGRFDPFPTRTNFIA